MFNELTFMDHNGVKVIDSREAAKIMGREHKEILMMIEGQKHKNGRVKHTGILPTISESGLCNSNDYFMKSSYTVEGNNKTYPCYLLTRKGCHMVAIRMTGKKGILFTAAYVNRYNEMEQLLMQQQPQPQLMVPQTFSDVLRLAAELADRE